MKFYLFSNKVGVGKRLRSTFMAGLVLQLLSLVAVSGTVYMIRSQLVKMRVSAVQARGQGLLVAEQVSLLLHLGQAYVSNSSVEDLRKMQLIVDQVKVYMPVSEFPELANAAKDFDRYLLAIGQTGVRFHSVVTNIERLSKLNATPAGRNIYSAVAGRLLTTLNVNMVRFRVVSDEEITEAVVQVRQQLGPKFVRSPALEDTLADVRGIFSTWNRVAEQYRKDYQPLEILVSRLAAVFALEQAGAMISYADQRLQPLMLLLGGLVGLFVVIFVLMMRGFQWVLAGWRVEMGSLKDLAAAALRGEAPELMAKRIADSEMSMGTDAVTLARKAIAETVIDLSRLRRDLETRVDERTKALRETQMQLVESAKFASLGSMAAGVAHELNNPLQVIMMLNERQMKTLAKAELPIAASEEVERQVMRMKRIIEQMKRLSRQSTSPSDENADQEAKLKELIQSGMILVERKLAAAGVVVVIEGVDEITIRCNPVRFETLVSNLADNALDAMNEKPAGSRQLSFRGCLNEDGSFDLRVRDTGVGIPEKIRQRVFEPFFTTKAVNQGTGLGLSLCRQVVLDMGGELSLNSEVGQYTEFTFCFPATIIKRVKLGTSAA